MAGVAKAEQQVQPEQPKQSERHLLPNPTQDNNISPGLSLPNPDRCSSILSPQPSLRVMSLATRLAEPSGQHAAAVAPGVGSSARTRIVIPGWAPAPAGSVLCDLFLLSKEVVDTCSPPSICPIPPHIRQSFHRPQHRAHTPSNIPPPSGGTRPDSTQCRDQCRHPVEQQRRTCHCRQSLPHVNATSPLTFPFPTRHVTPPLLPLRLQKERRHHPFLLLAFAPRHPALLHRIQRFPEFYG
jgi:hypothetical protein